MSVQPERLDAESVLGLTEPTQLSEPTKSTLSDRVSAAEWQTRVDLAACYRLVAHFGWTDLIYNHISARVPDEPEHFLINSYGLMYEEISASNLVKIDLDGRLLDDPIGWGINQAGFVVHSAVHAARHDAFCVIHTHTPAGVAVSAQTQGLLPLNQQAMWFYDRMGYHDYEGIALETPERERLVRNLGAHNALVLRNHGVLTLGATIPAAFQLMYFLENACRAQVLATAGGASIMLPLHDVCERAAQQFHRPGREANTRSWSALLRMLDRQCAQQAGASSYRE